MSNLTVNQIVSMTDEDLVADLVQSGDVLVCAGCGVPLQESITGCRTIMEDQRNNQVHCSDCYFVYKPFQEAVETFLVSQPRRTPEEKFEFFAGVPF